MLLLEVMMVFISQRTLTVEGMATLPVVVTTVTEKAAVQVIPCDGNRHTGTHSHGVSCTSCLMDVACMHRIEKAVLHGCADLQGSSCRHAPAGASVFHKHSLPTHRGVSAFVVSRSG